MPELKKIPCPNCGTATNHHASMPHPEAASRSGMEAADFVMEIHTCPACGTIVDRSALLSEPARDR